MRLFILVFFITALSAQFEPKLSKDFLLKRVFDSVYGYTVQLEDGVISVPNNRENPSYYITIPYRKLYSLAENPGPPIVHLVGGPGDDAFYHKRSIQAHYAEEFLRYGDVIFFNQRGAVKSDPDLTLSNGLKLPLNRSLSDSQSMKQFADQLKEQIDSFDDVNLSDYNTKENANDLDDLRKLLGYDKMILWGHSYGSHLGLAYINMFPENVERAIFTSINGLNDRYRIPSRSDSIYHRIHHYVKSDSILSKQIPDFLKLVREVHETFRTKAHWVKLDYRTANNYDDQGPVRRMAIWFNDLWSDSVNVHLGLAELQFSAMWQIHGTNSLSNVVQFYHRVSQGDYRQIALDNIELIKRAGPDSPLARQAMIYAMSISSGASAQQIQAINMDSKDAFISDVLNFPFYDQQIQNALGIDILPDSFRNQKTSELPVLFFNADLDIRTTMEAATDVIKSFPNGKLVVVKGQSHNFLHSDIRIRDAMEAFIKGDEVKIDTIDTRIKFRRLSEGRMFTQLKQLLDDSLTVLFSQFAMDSAAYFDENTLNSLAYVYMIAEDFSRAKLALEMNLKLFPEASNLYDSMGEYYFRTDDFDTARIWYKKSIELNPLNRNAYLYLYIMDAM